MKVGLEDIHKGCSPYSIPTGWRIALLKELSLLKISNGAFNDPKRVGSGYKLINISDLYRGPTIRTEALGRLSLSESEYKTFKVRRGDIFFTRSSLKKEGIAHCNIFLSDEENVVYECHMMRVRPDTAVADSKYLQEFCLAAPAREYFISHGKTTTMTTIDQGSIGGLPVLLPPLPEQQKISAILKAVDDKLDVIARQIEATQALKQGLMLTLFSQGVGTQDTNGHWVPHAEFKDSELGEIPAAWDVRPLDALAHSITVGIATSTTEHYVQDGIPLIRNQNIKEDFLDMSDLLQIAAEFDVKNKSKRVEGGDILTVRTGYPGVSCVVPDGLGRLQTFTTLITRPIRQLVNPHFVSRYFNSPQGKGLMLHQAAGGAQQNINAGNLKKLLVPVPSLSEQERIAAVLAAIDKKLRSLFSRREHCQNLKRGLMQKLLTGEWRVSLNTSVAGT